MVNTWTILLLGQIPSHAGWFHQVIGWMHTIQAMGVWGWGLFIGLFALCCLLFLPGSLITVAAGAIYGFWGGLGLVLLGNGLGSALSLIVSRCLLRDFVAKRIAHYPLFQALQQAVTDEDWKLVFLTRLSPVMPFSLINYSLGLTKISLWRFLLATELGSVPATIVYVYLGTLTGSLTRISHEMREHGALLWTLRGGGLVLAIGVTVYVSYLTKKELNRHRRRKSPKS